MARHKHETAVFDPDFDPEDEDNDEEEDEENGYI